LRDDIQWMRGLAVLAVLFYHADKALLPGGYLGVDVFFVLSGFLITRNVFPDVERGTFSYASFIARRFRRLLPACYAMLAFSGVLASLLLTRADLFEFLKQLTGTLTFSSNIVLWQQSGYFDTTSALKPLLHTWSLSLEEQYYLVLPPLLFLGARRRPIMMLVALFIGSLAICHVVLPFKPSAAFFLLPSRAWELLAGSICAVLSLKHRAPNIPTLLKLGALAAITATLFFPPASPHPGLAALIVVLATSILMIGALDFGTHAPARAMYFLGDISYSLYLFHWPLFAIANHLFAEHVPLHVSVALMVLSLILATLSYRFVEQPFRSAGSLPRKRVFLMAGAGAVALLLAVSASLALRAHAPGESFNDRAPNYGLDRSCSFDKEFKPRSECQSSSAPSVLLWGDSYAMHLAQALGQQENFGFLQATKSLCGPVPGVAPLNGIYNEAWASDCMAFNESVLRFVDKHPEIRVIVLASKWRQYFNAEGQEAFAVKDGAGALSRTPTLDPKTVASSLRLLSARLAASGRKVVLVLPPPSASFDIRRCIERRSEGLPFLGAPADCQIDRAASAARDATLSGILTSVGDETKTSVFSFESLLCTDEHCRTRIEGIPLYRDEGHFSARGSQEIGRLSALNTLIAASALHRARDDVNQKGHP